MCLLRIMTKIIGTYGNKTKEKENKRNTQNDNGNQEFFGDSSDFILLHG